VRVKAAGVLPPLVLLGLTLAHGFVGSLSDASGQPAPPSSIEAARVSAKALGVQTPRVVVRDPRPGEPVSGPFVLARPFFPATVIIPPWVVRHWPDKAVVGAVSHEVAHLAAGLSGRGAEIAADESAVRAVGCEPVVSALEQEPLDIYPERPGDTHPGARERLQNLLDKGLCQNHQTVALMDVLRRRDR
jgi:hypothetical protein